MHIRDMEFPWRNESGESVEVETEYPTKWVSFGECPAVNVHKCSLPCDHVGEHVAIFRSTRRFFGDKKYVHISWPNESIE